MVGAGAVILLISGLWFGSEVCARVSQGALLNRTLQDVEDFRCWEPQRRSIRISTLLDLRDKKIMPQHVILSRCDDQAGTCGNQLLSCTHTDSVKVQFAYTVIGQVSESIGEADNHTRCGCSDSSSFVIK